jgi:UDP-N-acetylmuramyl tripeptide synthase
VLEVCPSAAAAGALAHARLDVAVYAGLGAPQGADGKAALAAQAEDTQALAALFAAMSDPSRQRAVINADDPAAEAMVAAASAGAKVLTYSGEPLLPGTATPAPDVYPLSLDLSIWDTALTLATPLGELTLRSALVGRQAVGNIAAAVAVGVALGVPLELIAAGVEGLGAVPGRLESVDEGQPFAVIVDEARSAVALQRTLQAVRDCGAQHIITVVGATGDRRGATRCLCGRASVLPWLIQPLLLLCLLRAVRRRRAPCLAAPRTSSPTSSLCVLLVA